MHIALFQRSQRINALCFLSGPLSFYADGIPSKVFPICHALVGSRMGTFETLTTSLLKSLHA